MNPRRATTALAARPAPPKPPALVSDSLTRIEEEVGGREAIVAALAYAPKSRDLEYLLGLVGNPRLTTTPLADLCAQGGITPGELVEAYKQGTIARAQALALHEVEQRLAAVAADTMQRALPQEGVCWSCDGTGTHVPEPTKKIPNPDPQPCTPCHGTGRLIVPGDLDHKKLALEMGKLLPKGGGINLQVNQQQNTFMGAAAGGALERMQAATDAILYGADPLPAAILGDSVEVVEAESGEAEPLDAASADTPDTPILEGDWREEAHG